MCVQADKLIRELQSNNRLLKSELQATTTSFKQALHVAQTMLDTGVPPSLLPFSDQISCCTCYHRANFPLFLHSCVHLVFLCFAEWLARSLTHPHTHPPTHPPTHTPTHPCICSPASCSLPPLPSFFLPVCLSSSIPISRKAPSSAFGQVKVDFVGSHSLSSLSSTQYCILTRSHAPRGQAGKVAREADSF